MARKDNNPRNLPQENFKAYIGQQASFAAFTGTYEYAVEALYKLIAQENVTPDLIAKPLLFLMRHTLELGYKFTLFHLCSRNKTTFNPTAKGAENHFLRKLHTRLGQEYHQAVISGRVPDNAKTFDEYYSLTEEGMRIFDELDSTSTRFRFPATDERAIYLIDKTVNLLNLKNVFDDAMILLNTLVDVIGDDSELGSV